MKKLFFIQALALVFFTSMLFSTTYEDGTNNTGWHIESSEEDNNLVSTNTDINEGNIVSLKANSTELFLGGYSWDGDLRWDNSEDKLFNIKFKTTDRFEIVLLVVNSDGENRYLHYWESISIEDTQNNKYISLNQNTRDGNWHIIRRDLETDLGEPISKVNGMFVRRSNMDVSFVKLMSNGTTYEDGTNNTRWHIESTTEDNDLVTTDTDPNEGNIVNLEANSTELFLGGYSWDGDLRWDNSEDKLFNIRFKTTDKFEIVLLVVNSNGENRYLHYWESINIEDTQNNKYISLNQNTRDGNWHTIQRDLEADLGETISKVNGLFVRRANMSVAFVKMVTPLKYFSILDNKKIMFFNDGTHGTEPWVTNGESNGTHILKDINVGANGSGSPYYFNFKSVKFEIDGIYYFVANDGIHGKELWRTDGTEEGTVIVKDIRIGSEHSSPSNFKESNGILYFSANDGVHGVELWRSDGTEEGTWMVKDIWNGSSNSSPSSFEVLNGVLYFGADDGIHKRELWRSNGTEDGTVMVKDIRDKDNFSSAINNLINIDGTLYFSAEIPIPNSPSPSASIVTLWKSDGTQEGTVKVKELGYTSYGAGEWFNYPRNFVNLNGTLYFTIVKTHEFYGNQSVSLWKSDGTEAGTVMIKSMSSNANNKFFSLNKHLYLTIQDGEEMDVTGVKLWKTDGTEAGTVVIKDFNESNSFGSLSEFVNLNGTVYFRWYTQGGDDESSGKSHIWKTDNTEVGTIQVLEDIGEHSKIYGTVNAKIFFVEGNRLWVSDGTQAGTSIIFE